MDKNWLIRTKSNHILGPVSKEKVLELYHNGSIKPDDEICSGNGYWFFIREDDLVARFLLGSEIQSFNPISEAKDVLTSKGNTPPREESNDITLVGGINLSILKEGAASPVPASLIPPNPEANPALKAETPVQPIKETVSPEIKKKNNVEKQSRDTLPSRHQKPLKRQDWLLYLFIAGFIAVLILIYFRKTITEHLFEGQITSSFNLIDSAHAQEILPEKKKRF